MSLNPVKKLGQKLAGTEKDVNDLKSNINPDDPNASFPVFNTEEIVIEGTTEFRKRVYDSTSFIVDHPVYGDVDSSTLNIDGGYDTSDPEDDTVIFTGTI